MSRSILHFNKTRLILVLTIIFLIVLIPLMLFTGYSVYYRGKIFPNIFVAGINVGDISSEEAASYLTQRVPVNSEIKVNVNRDTTTLKSRDIDTTFNFPDSANNAYNLVRTGNFIHDSIKRIDLLFHPQQLGLVVNIDKAKLQKFVSTVSGQVSENPVYPSVKIREGQVEINRGSPGTEINESLFEQQIIESLAFSKKQSIDIPIKKVDPSLTDTEASNLKLAAEKYIDKKMQLNFEFSSYVFDDTDLVKFLNPKGGYDEQVILSEVDKLSAEINRDPQNPKFTFENGRVSEFLPAKDGVKVDTDKLKNEIINHLEELARSSDKTLSFGIPTSQTPPELTTEKVNNLGIKELIGRGTSTYFHSIPTRVHNVVLAASRINGTLIAPGETFSFNNTLGDVSKFTGYQTAYVIKDGKTVLGDGGGVCQVSSTLFRAILDSGLPVNERQAHAYRVSYYEQGSSPGFDATVYSPSPDLKFTNDTPAHILIVATADPKNYSLVFELYGTSDGRVASTTKPVVSNVSAPPADLYQDDPTLPAGTIKQIDFKAWGAKVTFNYKVTRNGETLINKTFVSNYRPWQAVYLRGTGPAN